MRLAKMVTGLFVGISLISSMNYSYALDKALNEDDSMNNEVVKFEIKPNKTEINFGDTFDVEVSALNRVGEVVKNYDKEIILYSDTDDKVVLPNLENESKYKFEEKDEGVKKFEDAVRFSKAGEMTLSVSEVDNPNVSGVVKIVVNQATQNTGSGDVVINYPENNTTISDENIKITGNTSPNHKVKLKIDGENGNEYIGDSNSEGVFEFSLEAVEQGDHSIVASLFDANDEQIGSSSNVKFTLEKTSLSLKDFRLNPEQQEYEAPATVGVEVDATPGLEKLEIYINDTANELKEDTERAGTYTGELNLTYDKGVYPVDVNLVSKGGEEKKEIAVKTIKIKNEQIIPEKKEIEFKAIKLDPIKEDDIYQKSDNVTVYVEATPGLDKLELSLDNQTSLLEEQKEMPGVYSKAIILPAIDGEHQFDLNMELGTESKKFENVKKVTIQSDDIKIVDQVVVSDDKDTQALKIEVDCDNFVNKYKIRNLNSRVEGKKSIITWDKVHGASGYNIYKKGIEGDLIFLEKTEKNKYAVDIVGDVETQESFAVEAVLDEDNFCKAKNVPIAATNVKTGAGETVFLISIFVLFGLLFIYRKQIFSKIF